MNSLLNHIFNNGESPNEIHSVSESKHIHSFEIANGNFR